MPHVVGRSFASRGMVTGWTVKAFQVFRYLSLDPARITRLISAVCSCLRYAWSFGEFRDESVQRQRMVCVVYEQSPSGGSRFALPSYFVAAYNSRGHGVVDSSR